MSKLRLPFLKVCQFVIAKNERSLLNRANTEMTHHSFESTLLVHHPTLQPYYEGVSSFIPADSYSAQGNTPFTAVIPRADLTLKV
jgi:hypothetical protein